MTRSSLVILAILLVSCSAFTSPRSASVCIGTARNDRLHPTAIHAAPSPTEDEPVPETNISESKYEGDPRKALEQFGSLFTQVQAIALEGGTWDAETLETKTQEFVRTYLQIFVPGIGYAVTSFGVFGSAFLTCLLSLNISGRGYNDILGAVSSIGPLRALLEKADPAWGNAAIALLGCEVLSPVILAGTLALTPKTMEAIQGKLNELGWGEDNIEERAADILRLTG